jgi:low affinity Fe/Cu permease
MRKKFEDFSKKVTRFIGSPQSIIIHTIFFIGMFSLRFFGISSSDVLLILTTIVSLEAIYLSIFIQMTVNQHAEELEEVSEDIEGIQEDVGEIQENVEEIQEDVEDIQEEIQEEENL